MVNEDEALKRAYDVLKNIAENATTPYEDDWCGAEAEEVLPVIKEALSQDEHEPPLEWFGIKAILDEYGLQAIDFVASFTQALAKPEQEPVANDWSVFNTGTELWSGLSLADAVAELTPERMERGWSAVCVINKDNPPLYTAPPKRTWVKLNAPEIAKIVNAHDDQPLNLALAIEAKLKEKNT